jgi:hypothetical protein
MKEEEIMKRFRARSFGPAAYLFCMLGILTGASGAVQADGRPRHVKPERSNQGTKLPEEVQRQHIYDALQLRAQGPAGLQAPPAPRIHGGKTIVSPAVEGFAAGEEELGACCNLNTGECLEQLAFCDCLTSGGSWFGGLACSEVPLCSSDGACCNLDAGECTDGLAVNECFNSGGTFWTPDTACADVACPPTGACCDFATSTCTNDVPVLDCFGPFYVDMTCDEIVCPPTGACCDLATGTCTNDVSLFECFNAGGLAYEGLTCDDIVCPPMGACCQVATGTCTDDVPVNDCIDSGGFPFEGLTCDQFTCPQIDLGACCDAGSGECFDGIPALDCSFAPLGAWFEGQACSEIACPPVGACCDQAAGTCTDTEQSNCSPAHLWYETSSCAEIDCPADTECGFANPSFETGNFGGWIAQDLAVPFFPMTVAGSGIEPGFGFFLSEPPDGDFAALTGWDGEGPGTIVLAQDIEIPQGATTLEFDYRAAWDLASFCAQLDRTFAVSIQPAGGGMPLEPAQVILTAPAGTIQLDTGGVTGVADISAHAGSAVRVSFEWSVPENFSGPAFFQLDNLRCTVPDGDCECSDGKVTICHRPPGNPDNAKTLSVGCSALEAHLGHGDTCGPCD